MTAKFQEFFDIVESKERFLIGCHVHPDGDAIGSLLAMGLALLNRGKKVEMVCSEGVPNVYYFLEGSRLINREINFSASPEVLICVDCAEKERISLPPEVWSIKGLTVINIDHHITNGGFGDLNLIDSNVGATGELIFYLLREGRYPIDRKIATALYTAVATDTGFFRYANTSASVLEAALSLVRDFQVEPAKVAEQVHEQKSYNSILMLGEVLRTLQRGAGGRVAWMVLDQKLLSRYAVENEETESFVNYARSIEGVEIGLLFKELRPNEIKLSWRSASNVDVSKLASYFGGGGHTRAAGCNIAGPVSEVVKKVLNFIDDYYRES